MVTIGQSFFLSTEDSVLTVKGGTLKRVGTAIFGGPVVAADCTYVYYSNVFDGNVHRYDEESGLTTVIASDVGVFDASAEAGAYPGTAGLAAANDRVFATTGSRQLYAMPNDPIHPAEVLVSNKALGHLIVADGRFVYYMEVVGDFTSVMFRIAPDGGGRQQLSTGGKKITAIASDADHLSSSSWTVRSPASRNSSLSTTARSAGSPTARASTAPVSSDAGCTTASASRPRARGTR